MTGCTSLSAIYIMVNQDGEPAQGGSYEIYFRWGRSAPLRAVTGLAAVRWKFVRSVMKLRDLAAVLGCRLEGDGELEITGVAGMEHAVPGQITFLANPKYAPRVKQTRASAILVAEAIPPMACLISPNPY